MGLFYIHMEDDDLFSSYQIPTCHSKTNLTIALGSYPTSPKEMIR